MLEHNLLALICTASKSLNLLPMHFTLQTTLAAYVYIANCKSIAGVAIFY